MVLANRIQTILCDDIRQETGNKFSLMGVYIGNIIVKDLPTILPKLCLCIILEKAKVDFRECNITLRCPESEPMHFKLTPPKENRIGLNTVLFFTISPFMAKATGTAKFSIYFDKNKKPSFVHKFEIQQAS